MDILRDEKAVNVNEKSSNFWIMAHCLKDFVEKEGNGQLPLMGSLPDMTATTDVYVALQRMYSFPSFTLLFFSFSCFLALLLGLRSFILGD